MYTNEDENNNIEEKHGYGMFIVIGILYVLINVGYSLYILVDSVRYENNISCNTVNITSIPSNTLYDVFGVITWIKINSAISCLASLGITLLMCSCINKKNIYLLSCGIIIISIIFRISWIILGYVMFIQICPNIQPLIINSYVWIMFIFGLLEVGSSFIAIIFYRFTK